MTHIVPRYDAPTDTFTVDWPGRPAGRFHDSRPSTKRAATSCSFITTTRFHLRKIMTDHIPTALDVWATQPFQSNAEQQAAFASPRYKDLQDQRIVMPSRPNSRLLHIRISLEAPPLEA